MKVSVIIAVYKDVEALHLILKSLATQTYKDFEVVIAEDGNSSEIKDFLGFYLDTFGFKIVHTSQNDKGVRKSRSQNNGIRAASGNYLIFIDGDCLLYSNFIENHLLLSGKKYIVTGRRVNVGPIYSSLLRKKSISSQWLEKNFFRKYFAIKDDAKKERHTEEGFSIKPNGLVHKLMKTIRKKPFPLLGCNMSMYKAVILDINGFDANLGNLAIASDTDLEWRFRGLGYVVISAKFMANQFHLYHERKEFEYNRGNDNLMNKNKSNKIYRCRNGIYRE
ncbi:MAG: glycosyltransferase [Flavobacteriales bacterium]|nr:glycosyltransferase [Flavobacteriales bacterium]